MKDTANTIAGISVCPRCGQTYHGRPAVSRADNKTLLCPDCGTREALESIGVDEKEQEQILEAIHRCYGATGQDDEKGKGADSDGKEGRNHPGVD